MKKSFKEMVEKDEQRRAARAALSQSQLHAAFGTRAATRAAPRPCGPASQGVAWFPAPGKALPELSPPGARFPGAGGGARLRASRGPQAPVPASGVDGWLPRQVSSVGFLEMTKADQRLTERQAKPDSEEGFGDCSICTFRNSAEAFKCSICDVGKGTSTRKPRINSQLVAQQVAQQDATPPPPKKEKKEKVGKHDKEKPDKDKDISPSVTKKNTNKKTKPKSDILKDPPSEANSLQSANVTTKTSERNHTSRPWMKNVDRSTTQQVATVGNVTVIITDFKKKTQSCSTSSSTVTSSAGSEQQIQSSSGSESTDKGSSRSSTPKGDMSAVNDESF
ncbi:LOW QUALITY PROTEIN: RING1 and YY1-binding protein-like [Peromyscus leucopus]|uniref:LOW QUALITY PROTEIN: RING1 and YY1-binding protein-like n=1 Tax=Peromyscus leucopus TaxID=10041 RepID=UPI001884C147|nr:LOW QUALITY PROTEIN: RING1 and YY1-binding protein-like [Peromyscus leucopus]